MTEKPGPSLYPVDREGCPLNLGCVIRLYVKAERFSSRTSSYSFSQNRSLPIDTFPPLADRRGPENVFSLQKEDSLIPDNLFSAGIVLFFRPPFLSPCPPALECEVAHPKHQRPVVESFPPSCNSPLLFFFTDSVENRPGKHGQLPFFFSSQVRMKPGPRASQKEEYPPPFSPRLLSIFSR